MNPLRSLLRLVLGKRLPISEGIIHTHGVNKRLTIQRDAYGIPYISAQTDADAWYGLGFCQGQDRAFQVEMLSRLSRGTLSEIFGEQTLSTDKLSRRIGFHRYAKQKIDLLSDDIRCSLEAFTRGMNDGVRLGLPKWPHENALLRSEPIEYEVVDILAGFNYVSFGLSTWSSKLMRMMIASMDSLDGLTALNSRYAEWMPVTRPVAAPAGPELDRLATDLTHLMSAIGTDGLSNNWVVNAVKTDSERPLLANDPHLAPSVPPPWYLAHLRTSEWAVSGACFAGSPIFAAGHNDVAAWGVTAGLADNLDLYIEKLSDDRRSVQYGETMVPCEIIRETIHIKNMVPVHDEIILTPRGPVVSDQFADISYTISMQALWMQPRPMEGLFTIFKAQSFDEFRQAFQQWPLASLNMVYADTSDTVGWQLIGGVPRRKGAWGLTPLPGWDPEIGWETDPIPFDEMPHLENPGPGFIATANNKPIRDNEGPYLGKDWSEGYRLARITARLETDELWSLEKFSQMQLDTHTLVWEDIKNDVLNSPTENIAARRAIIILSDWDGNVDVDSPAAAVYQVFVTQLLRRILHVKAPKTKYWVENKTLNPMVSRVYLPGPTMTDFTRLLQTKPKGWFPAGWDHEIIAALARAIHFMENHSGPDPSDWAWGQLHNLTLMHPLGEHPHLKKVFNLGPIPVGGDSFTISHTGRDLHDPTANPTVIANLRMVLDIGNWDYNAFILAGGQSGNPFSPHYSDQFNLWAEGKTITLPWSDAAIQSAAQTTLTIAPE